MWLASGPQESTQELHHRSQAEDQFQPLEGCIRDHKAVLVNDTSPAKGLIWVQFRARIPFSLHDNRISDIAVNLLDEDGCRKVCGRATVKVSDSDRMILQGGEL